MTSTNAAGCTHTEILNLTITGGSTTDTTVRACGSYVWHGDTYSASGNYTYNSGCATETLHLTIVAVPATPVAVATQPTCKASGTVKLSTPAVAGSGLIYSVNDFASSNTTGTFTNLTPGSYTIKVRNANGCVAESNAVTLTASSSAPVVYNVTSTGGTCANQGTVISVDNTSSNARVFYRLMRGTAKVTEIQGTGSGITYPTQTLAGVYTVVAYDSSSLCLNVMDGEVVINALPVAPKGTPASVTGCPGADITLTATPGAGLIVDWYDALTGGNLVQSGTDTGVSHFVANVLATTKYYVSTRNPVTGCVSATRAAVTATISIVKPPVVAITQPTCAVDTGSLKVTVITATSATSAYTYMLPGDNAFRSYTTSPQYVRGLPAGTYVTRVRNFYGCETSTTSIISAQPSSPQTFTVLGNGSPNLSSCAGQQVTVSLSGTEAGIRYILKRGTASADTIVGNGGPMSFVKVQTLAGVYSVVATNLATKCATTMTGGVTINALPANPVGTKATGCQGSTITISATSAAGNVIDWYASATGGTSISPNSNSYTVPSTNAGTVTYYAQARNATTGCMSLGRTAVMATVTTFVAAGPITPANTCSSTRISTYTVTKVTGMTYTWTISNSSTAKIKSGQGTNVLTVVDSALGSKTISVVASNASCGATPASTINVSSCVLRPIAKAAAAEVKPESAFVVKSYPNPVTGNVLNVELVNQAAGRYTLQLFNAFGQEIYRKQIQHLGGTYTEKIEVNNKMGRGGYFLKVTEGERVVTQKIIRQ